MLINFIRYIVSSGYIKLNNTRDFCVNINVIVNRRAPPLPLRRSMTLVKFGWRQDPKIGKGGRERKSSLVVTIRNAR